MHDSSSNQIAAFASVYFEKPRRWGLGNHGKIGRDCAVHFPITLPYIRSKSSIQIWTLINTLFYTCFIISCLVQTGVENIVMGSILVMKKVASFLRKHTPFKARVQRPYPNRPFPSSLVPLFKKKSKCENEFRVLDHFHANQTVLHLDSI